MLGMPRRPPWLTCLIFGLRLPQNGLQSGRGGALQIFVAVVGQLDGWKGIFENHNNDWLYVLLNRSGSNGGSTMRSRSVTSLPCLCADYLTCCSRRRFLEVDKLAGHVT